MNLKKIFTWLAPFALVGIVAVFIYNVYSHGQIDHPGKSMYKDKCAQCHGDNGEGIRELVPPMTDKEFTEKNFDSIPCWIKNGLNHPITIYGKIYDQPMYPNHLDEVQAANVINYISKEFAKSDKEVNSVWVRERWKECP